MKDVLGRARVWIVALATSVIAAMLVFGGVYIGSRVTHAAEITQDTNRLTKTNQIELQKIDELLKVDSESRKGLFAFTRFDQWLAQDMVLLCHAEHVACPPLPTF